MKSTLVSHAVRACLCLCAGVPLLSAQTPLPAPVNVSMKLDFVAWGDSIMGLRIKLGGSEVPVSAHAFEYSKVVSYSGSNILEIMQGKTTLPVNPDATPEAAAPPKSTDPNKPPSELEIRRAKNPDLVALAILPSDSRRVTVLIAAAANGTYQTYVIDDDPTKLPLGKLRIHNYCSIPIAMRCNGQKTAELLPKQTTIISPVDQGVVYELSYKKEDKWKMQENNLIKVEDSEQVQLVVLKSESDFFTSGDGSRGGFLQTVVLRRNQKRMAEESASSEGQTNR